VVTSTQKPKVASRPRIDSVQRSNHSVEHHVLGETLGLHISRHSRHIGLTSPFDPTLIGLSQFDSRNESVLNIGTLRKVNDHETFIMYADEEVHDFSDDADALDAIDHIISPHGPALIDLYFRIVHPSFPIIQKRVFLERFRGGERNFAPALLAGMYILALNWWSHDPKLASKQRPDASQLDTIASKSLSAGMQRPKLSTVQAGLLLLQRPEADSWSLTTQLVAIGQELGLHLDCSNWSIPLWERELRKRIAWALYMQDKWSSLIHGRPSHIFGANWAVQAMSDDDTVSEESQGNPNAAYETDEEKEEIEKGRILFSQMISLTSIMAEIMDTFYTQTAIAEFASAGRNSTRLILDRAKPVQIKLKEWFARLPSVVRMDNVTARHLSSTGMLRSRFTSGQTLTPLGFLHLAYFATEITLHRRIVQSLNSETSDPYLMHICRSAAKTRLISAMDFVNRLKPEHLQAFWYFPSKINFTLIGTFGGLLWATAPAKEEADFYKARLREYRWTLSVSSKRAEFLDFAVQMLDTSRAMLSNLSEKPALAQAMQVSSAGVPRPDVDGAGAGPLGAASYRPVVQHRVSSSSRGDLDEDRTMEDASTLTRTTTSGSAFSGFSNDALEQYSETSKERDSPVSTQG